MRAFVPNPLPPMPPLQFDRRLPTSLEATSIAVGRLGVIGTLSPTPAFSPTATFASGLSSRRESSGRDCCRPSGS